MSVVLIPPTVTHLATSDEVHVGVIIIAGYVLLLHIVIISDTHNGGIMSQECCSLYIESGDNNIN